MTKAQQVKSQQVQVHARSQAMVPKQQLKIAHRCSNLLPLRAARSVHVNKQGPTNPGLVEVATRVLCALVAINHRLMLGAKQGVQKGLATMGGGSEDQSDSLECRSCKAAM